MVSRINWDALRKAALDLKIESPFNEWTSLEGSQLENADFLQYAHHLLFEVHVLDGTLVCPESNRKFPVKDGIPNMLLHEDEI